MIIPFRGQASLLQIGLIHKTQWLMGPMTEMNDRGPDHYRRLLADQLSDLERQDARGQDAQRTVTLDQQSIGRLSRMDAMQQQAMAKATQARRNQMKQRIRAALIRLDEGEFGYCLICGEDIAPKRLDLDPTALTCVACANS
jgi:RNA polymerase-binding transcription factor